MLNNKLYSILTVILIITAGTGALFASAMVDAGISLFTQPSEEDAGEQGVIYTGDPVRDITDTWTSGDCTCMLDYNARTFYVTGSGAMADYQIGTQPWSNMHARIVTVVIESGVTAIGQYAFSGCAVTSVTFANSVRTIGQGAFYDCTSLVSISVPSTVTSITNSVFAECTALQTVELNASVSEIGASTFQGCTSLTSITIPGTVTDIQQSAFEGCTSLASVSLPYGLQYIYGGAFSGCTQLTQINFPGTIAGIGEAAFMDCTGLTSLLFPASVFLIDNGAFMGCSNVTQVVFETLSWNITVGIQTFDLGTSTDPAEFHVYSINNLADGCLDSSIGQYTTVIYEASMWSSGQCICLLDQQTGVFRISGIGVMADYDSAHEQPWMSSNRLKITSVVVENGVTYIGAMAFSGVNACTNLTAVDLGTTVRGVGNSAFNGCTSLATVSSPSSLLSIGSQAYFNCTSLTSAAPGTVTNIGLQAYGGCTSLTTVRIVAGTTYGEGVYVNCTSISTVTIEYGVTSIAPMTFSGCTSLPSVIIPATVSVIGWSAFYGCSSLVSITFLSQTWNVTSIGSNAFSLGSYASPLNSVVYSPGNLADGRLDAYSGDYTTFSYISLPDYTVTIVAYPSDYGSVSQTSISVPWGTQVQIQNNTIIIGSDSITATPAPVSVEYTYAFDSWTGVPVSGSITSDIVITANFVRTQNYYEVSFVSNDPEYGHLSAYGPFSILGNTQVTISGSTITIGQYSVTAIPTDPTIEYVFAFDGWTDLPSQGKITENTTIGADFIRTIRNYTVTIVSSDTSLGTVDVSSLDVPYNSRIVSNDNVLSVGATNVRATPLGTALFISWNGIPQSQVVTEDLTVTAYFEQLTIVFSDLSINPTMYGVIGKALPWVYNPFTVSLNVPVAGEWSITDPVGTGLTINKKTGAFGGSISSQFPMAGSALITVKFSPTGSSGYVSATFTLHYVPALIITS